MKPSKKFLGVQFDQFWAAYPRRVGKFAARRAFARIKGREFDEIMAALETQKKLKQWQQKKFIPHASTWLNQYRYKDVYDEMDDFIRELELEEAF